MLGLCEQFFLGGSTIKKIWSESSEDGRLTLNQFVLWMKRVSLSQNGTIPTQTLLRTCVTPPKLDYPQKIVLESRNVAEFPKPEDTFRKKTNPNRGLANKLYLTLILKKNKYIYVYVHIHIQAINRPYAMTYDFNGTDRVFTLYKYLGTFCKITKKKKKKGLTPKFLFFVHSEDSDWNGQRSVMPERLKRSFSRELKWDNIVAELDDNEKVDRKDPDELELNWTEEKDEEIEERWQANGSALQITERRKTVQYVVRSNARSRADTGCAVGSVVAETGIHEWTIKYQINRGSTYPCWIGVSMAPGERGDRQPNYDCDVAQFPYWSIVWDVRGNKHLVVESRSEPVKSNMYWENENVTQSNVILITLNLPQRTITFRDQKKDTILFTEPNLPKGKKFRLLCCLKCPSDLFMIMSYHQTHVRDSSPSPVPLPSPKLSAQRRKSISREEMAEIEDTKMSSEFTAILSSMQDLTKQINDIQVTIQRQNIDISSDNINVRRNMLSQVIEFRKDLDKHQTSLLLLSNLLKPLERNLRKHENYTDYRVHSIFFIFLFLESIFTKKKQKPDSRTEPRKT
ncbi:hypothetical protein RFI_22053 [Reticulomyxa filosa]|uniref:Uncharacterized protein n=1 Tax=Reticulomyxa filosa TaxID=46433 RepID=X6MPE6_RETFI|nr:hypothetical protein RFI_22053 [Reticulomyxa filosa]|eukprot:ETO15312.1 hypothetical protein RFI_22053 [Reticulomyxa filosa]